MNVGIRELKAKLSEYVAAAANGQNIVVTDRGKPVAELSSFHGGSAVQRGIDEGWIEAPRRNGLSATTTRHKAKASIATTLDEDRG